MTHTDLTLNPGDSVTISVPVTAPVPTPTPIPTPTPPPSSRPFPAPVTTHSVTVPSTIDATGGTDVRAALQSFIDAQPNGSVITFPTGKMYRVSGGLSLQNRSNLVFAGNGSTIRSTADGSQANSFFFLRGSSDIAFRDLSFTGANPNPGHMSTAGEFASPVHILGGSRIELAGGTVRSVHGDGTVTANGNVKGVWVHDVNVIDCGRNAMSVVWGSDILVEKNTVGPCGWAIFDIEPEVASNGSLLSNIAFLDNACTTWNSDWHGFFLGAAAGTGSTVPIDGLRVERNTVSGNTLQSWIGSKFETGRRRNVTFLDNTGAKGSINQGAQGLIWFNHCDTVTYGRNVSPLTAGKLYAVTDSTNVTVVS